ncbi:MAG: hypothetical protein Ta2A_06370 [Treponemataceae bacterium]|nr:MAG: hypothetical protein Ta2A_06370 [Treponemataceae bacterium]
MLQYPQGKTGTTYTIPNSVTSIGDRAFFGCSSLTSVTIPDSVESIGRSAFYGCSSLTSVTIPSSVTSIAYSAFAYCSNLTSVTMRPLSPPTLGSDAFSSTPSGAFSSTPAGFKIKVASALFDTYKNTTVSGWSNYKSRVVEE